jgi:immune inhibitor A
VSLSPWQPSDPPPPRKRIPRDILAALVILLVAVVSLTILAANYISGYGQEPPVGSVFVTPFPRSTLIVPQATAPGSSGLNAPEPPTPTPAPTLTLTPVSAFIPSIPTLEPPSPTPLSPEEQSLRTLDQAEVPARDLYAIAQRLKLKTLTPIPRGPDVKPGNYQVGHTDPFFMSDITEKTYYTITATVKQVTAHAYWYVQDGQPIDQAALKRASTTFENNIYPTDHSWFGSEWTPGVDNDPRITVLFAPISGAGGYYASADEYTRAVNPFSNQREIIYIDIKGGWVGIESILAHEFQHMIHWHEHPRQEVWLNEGASVLASALNGYSQQGYVGYFTRNPDIQLTAWQSPPSLAIGNYGAAYLFLDYLRVHYGGSKVIRAAISARASGGAAIDEALASVGSPDRFLDVFKRWTLANLVDEQPGADAQGLDYPDLNVAASPHDVISDYPQTQKGVVTQFGADYTELSPPQSELGTAQEPNALHVDFSGGPDTVVIPTKAHSGSSIWWSNRGDVADMNMTRPFDLRSLKSATLDFYTWFDIEEDLDYGYAEVSTDGGATWETLRGRYTTDTNPNGTNFGTAFTGRSADKQDADRDGWLHESINLSAYAGKEIQVRFEYITDDAYNVEGMAVDDISIPELGYTDNAETDMGWQSVGFVRVANELPQKYYLAVVKFKQDGSFEVQPIDVSAAGKASFDIDGIAANGPYTKAVVLVAGLTNYVLQGPDYELSVQAK